MQNVIDAIQALERPRLLVCSHEDYPSIQRRVTELGQRDVVRPSRFVLPGRMYVMEAHRSLGPLPDADHVHVNFIPPDPGHDYLSPNYLSPDAHSMSFANMTAEAEAELEAWRGILRR